MSIRVAMNNKKKLPIKALATKQVTYFEQHEFIEWIVPLHKEDSVRHSPAKVLVTIVWVSTHAAFGAALGIGNFGSQCKFARNQLLRYLVHVQRKPMRLFALQLEQIVAVQLRRFPRQRYQHVFDDVHPNCSSRI